MNYYENNLDQEKEDRIFKIQTFDLDNKNPFYVLGIPDDSSADEIKRAFRVAVKMFHEDMLIRYPPEIIKKANKIFKLIKDAKNALDTGKPMPSFDADYDPLGPELAQRARDLTIKWRKRDCEGKEKFEQESQALRDRMSQLRQQWRDADQIRQERE